MLYVALSCLQGRPALDAGIELIRLAPGAVGLQLTPGCTPSELDVTTIPCAQRTHHGWTPNALRTRVWNRDGSLAWKGHSAHPPMQKDLGLESDGWFEKFLASGETVALETMYPGYAFLSNGEQIEDAMAAGIPLTVDVSHIYMQLQRHVMTGRTWNRLLEYDNIVEIHVSENDSGMNDSHRPIKHSTFGLSWVWERLYAGTPIVLESYLHRLSEDERKAQVALLLEGGRFLR